MNFEGAYCHVGWADLGMFGAQSRRTGKSCDMPFLAWHTQTMSYSQNIGPYSFKSPPNQISMSVKVFPNFTSLPLNNLLGFHRQTESLYYYQTHHHQLTVVDSTVLCQLANYIKSQPLNNLLGSHRQTESLCNYQTHHHQLTVVDSTVLCQLANYIKW